MKKLLILSLLIAGCAETDLDQDMTGQWQIIWSMEEGSRSGDLILNHDHTGEIVLEENINSFILPKAENIKVKWANTKDKLSLTRIDNGFVLDYQINNRTQNSIDLSFAGDINILLIRQ